MPVDEQVERHVTSESGDVEQCQVMVRGGYRASEVGMFIECRHLGRCALEPLAGDLVEACHPVVSRVGLAVVHCTEVVDVVFQSFNGYLGVGVGEHLGYLLTGAWTALVAVAITQTAALPSWLGFPGIAIGALLAMCALEFVGPAERTGWKLAGMLTPIVYIAWSLWLVSVGIALLV